MPGTKPLNVELTNHIQHEPPQMPRRQPLPQIRRHKKLLITLNAPKLQPGDRDWVNEVNGPFVTSIGVNRPFASHLQPGDRGAACGAAQRYPGSKVKVSAVDAIRDNNGLIYQRQR
ncbi:hypothetical protein [Saccharopolyspora spinosa]|uniref:hypothetical protein n=1 Tax=Saccharopolyspora spinosa TaxID=60894 RepID=UPI000237AE9A